MGWDGVERRKHKHHVSFPERRAVGSVKRRDDVTPGTWTPADSGLLMGSSDPLPSFDSGSSFDSSSGSSYDGGGGSFDGGGASGDW